MKLILSRKGFDSENGGIPSPILPDNRLISLPIPEFHPTDSIIHYNDLFIEGFGTYYNLIDQLSSRIRANGKWMPFTKEAHCHLDPDIVPSVLPRKREWRPIFGQIDSAETHLRNQNIQKGDVFLFFGWFKETMRNPERLCYSKEREDKHIIFGYMQVGNIMNLTMDTMVPEWMEYHPHNDKGRKNNRTNTVYIAQAELTWNKKVPGAGSLMFDKELVLTKDGFPRCCWDLPQCFRDKEISYHTKHSWTPQYFKSASRGQEFVVKGDKEVENWVMDLIDTHRQIQ